MYRIGDTTLFESHENHGVLNHKQLDYLLKKYSG